MVKCACLLSLFGFTACSTPPPPLTILGSKEPHRELAARVRAASQLAVLFVGNSYSFGVPKEFARIAAAHGKNIRVGHAAYGGWSLKMHAANEATLRKIRTGHWDIVVIQEHSKIPSWSAGKRAAAMNPPLFKLVAEARQHGAIPVLYQTWGRRDGDKSVWLDTFHTMTKRLRAGYQAAAREAGGLVVVPVGDAWEREVSASKGSELFMADGSHPTATGNQLTADVFYETLFAE
jgi:hypothetical protein